MQSVMAKPKTCGATIAEEDEEDEEVDDTGVETSYRCRHGLHIKRTKNPDVFKSAHSDTYIIFGEAKIQDLSSQLQAQVAHQFRMPDMQSVMAKLETSGATIAKADEEDEEVHDTGVEVRDIDMVMTQAGVTRNKDVKALKTHDGDIVSAIMELTT